jgi:hypothetical protein
MLGAQEAEVSAVGTTQGQQSVPPKPRKRLLAPIVIVVVVILILAVLAIAFVFVASKKDNSTPEDAFRDYAAAAENNDTRALFRETVYSLGDLYDKWLDQTGVDSNHSDLHVTINSLEVAHNESMTGAQRAYVENLVTGIEYGLSVSVEDACILNANITESYTYSGAPYTETFSFDLPCVKVDSKWYLVVPEDIALDWYWESIPHAIGVQIARAPYTGGYSFTLTPTESLTWDQVTVVFQEVSPATVSGTWNALTSAALGGGGVKVQALGSVSVDGNKWLNVTDLAGNGELNTGDYMTITGAWTMGHVYKAVLLYKADGSTMGSIQWTA